MAAAGLSFEPLRGMLLQAIVASVNSWPELHRRIFTEIHYEGKSAEELARSLSMSPYEVLRALRHCESKLHLSLRSLRDGCASVLTETSHPEMRYSSACCSH
jgi:DNA-directed RNA polymerase specialized sigma24 family protein